MVNTIGIIVFFHFSLYTTNLKFYTQELVGEEAV